jgi:predicted dehydrogenase
MTEEKKISRRRLLQQSLGVAVAGMTLPACKDPQEPPNARSTPSKPSAEAVRTASAPNNELGVGIIGCGRRSAELQIGRGGQGKLPEAARIVAVSDVHLVRANDWADDYQCPAFQNYRSLLDLNEVDAVVYATPEHWHYLVCIHACQAGKDVYGEQPLSHSIREGRAMVDTVRKYDRVFQGGEQQRSHTATRHGVELILNGRIGEIRSVVGFNYPSPWECGFAGQKIPEGLDWDAWCGPNEVVPYHRSLYLSRGADVSESTKPLEPDAVGPGWTSFRPYSGGELARQGYHALSMVQWALGFDNTGPVEVWVDPAEKLDALTYDQPETAQRGNTYTSRTIISYRFADGVVLTLNSQDEQLRGGARFIGDNGEITVVRGQYTCKPIELDEEPLPADAIRVVESDNHMQNFYDCVESREDPIMHAEAAHRVATLCHLGNIARRLGRPLRWDPDQEVFVGDEEANQFLDTHKREPYALPSSAWI